MTPPRTVAAILRSAVSEPALTVQVLLAHALGRDRTWLFAHPEYCLTPAESDLFDLCLSERLAGKPTQYITGVQEFYGRPFLVTPDVLIPRPETEHVVEAALEVQPAPGRVLDICTGSGAIAVTLACELNRPVVASDISHSALLVARENARRNLAMVEFVCADALGGFTGPFSLITANPPYVPEDEIEGLQREIRDWEPRVALDGGPAGMDVYRKIVASAADLLAPGGWLIFEMGYRTEPFLRTLFLSGPWHEPATRFDLASLPRVLAIQRR